MSSYVPLEKRKPLDAEYIKRVYWVEQKTTHLIAESQNVPEYWIIKEIKRLGLGKKQCGVKHRDRKGYVMSLEEREKHKKQPHAKPVVQIDPNTFEIVREYSSVGAVEKYGFVRSNVRSAIQRVGLHKGYMWAYKSLADGTIRVCKKKDVLGKKLQVYNYKRPSKEELEDYYVIQGKTLKECGRFFGCHPITIATLAGKYGLKRRDKKIDIKKLEYLYAQCNLTARDVALKCGCSATTVATYLSRNGIKKAKNVNT